MPIADPLQYGLAALVNNLIYATVAFALALLTRSMAGGMALALVFAFVIDSLLSAIPVVGDYALSTAVRRAHAGISGIGPRRHRRRATRHVLRALGVTAVWLVAMLGVSVDALHAHRRRLTARLCPARSPARRVPSGR